MVNVWVPDFGGWSILVLYIMNFLDQAYNKTKSTFVSHIDKFGENFGHGVQLLCWWDKILDQEDRYFTKIGSRVS